MPASEARMAANRRNAQLSSGPKTPEGKERSRANALKHGLTGQGVALPTEDADEVVRRFETLQAELRPSGELGRLLVRRVAYLSVRLERSERHDTASLATRIRNAETDFDDRRLREVEVLVRNLGHDPATSARRLQSSPEGLDWLITHWTDLKVDLFHESRDAWSYDHRGRMENLMGRYQGNFRVTRVFALSEAMGGHLGYLDPGDGEGLEGPAMAEWARRALGAMIDAELGRLREIRETFDVETIARDRAEAADRALFDPSKEAVLARKYEAATERGLFRTLRALAEAEAASTDPGAGDPAVESLGSFLPEAEEPTDPPVGPPPAPVDRPVVAADPGRGGSKRRVRGDRSGPLPPGPDSVRMVDRH